MQKSVTSGFASAGGKGDMHTLTRSALVDPNINVDENIE